MNLRTNDIPQASQHYGLTSELVLSCITSAPDCASDFPQITRIRFHTSMCSFMILEVTGK